MTYSRRFIAATIVSVALHIFMLWLGHRAAEAKPKPVIEEAKNVPLTFNLEPSPIPESEKSEAVKRLISTPNPTTEEVEETDLISNNDSKAQDESDVEGERSAPYVEEPDDHDRIEQAPSEPQPAIPEQVETVEMLEPPVEEFAEPLPEPETQEPSAEEIEELQEEVTQEEITPNELALVEIAEELESTPENADPDTLAEEPKEEVTPVEEIVEESDEDVTEAEEDPLERYDVAQALPQAPQPATPKFNQDLSASRGRAGGGASQKGILNFEAKSHELGEYMLEVRRRVERQWHGAIQLRYLGVKRAEAVIECVIRPSGIIEEVRIVDPGGSMPFAIICRDSIVDAGPFQKLPFDVPEIYRSQNIEIRWRFSYL